MCSAVVRPLGVRAAAAQATRESILRAATKVFAKHGFAGGRVEQIVLVHGVRQVDELAYHDLLTRHLPEHEVLGELVTSQLRYYPTVTRKTYHNMGRVTELMDTGKLFADLKMPALDAANDRVMMCGSPAMLRDLKHMLEKRGFREGNTSTPGDFVIERAFAEQ